jgi:hypothetical protein
VLLLPSLRVQGAFSVQSFFKEQRCSKNIIIRRQFEIAAETCFNTIPGPGKNAI